MHAPSALTPGPAPQLAVTGTHIIADLYGCPLTRHMTDCPLLEQTCLTYVREAGLLDVGSTFHGFPGEGETAGGVTGTVVLAESHLCLHTWPEHGYVSLDVFVCNYSTDNTDAARNLADRLVALFRPEHTRRQEITR